MKSLLPLGIPFSLKDYCKHKNAILSSRPEKSLERDPEQFLDLTYPSEDLRPCFRR